MKCSMFFICGLSFIAVTGCSTLEKDKDSIKKITDDLIDEALSNAASRQNSE